MRVRPDPYDVAGQIAVGAAASPSDVLRGGLLQGGVDPERARR